MTREHAGPRFDTRTPVDFVIVGSGASGGVLAKELSTAGFDVVVLEQGPYRTAGDFSHDDLAVMLQREMTRHPGWDDPQSLRSHANEKARVYAGDGPPPALYARGVGGSSVHFTANYWRLRPVDFHERSLLGPIAGIMVVDYFLVKNQSYDVLALYQDDAGYPAWNKAGFIAFLVPVGLTLIAITTGALGWFYTYGWFTGSILGGLIYYFVAGGGARSSS